MQIIKEIGTLEKNTTKCWKPSNSLSNLCNVSENNKHTNKIPVEKHGSIILDISMHLSGY